MWDTQILNQKIYRKILWDEYSNATDQDIMALVSQIKAFIYPIINRFLQWLSDEEVSLSSNLETND